jgi:solute carrier family 25 phosphate transporter 23/24/25/41
MKAPTSTPWIAKIEQGLDESQNQRDARLEKLWRKLDPKGTGELDLTALKAAFKRIDHPMKNADSMLKRILERLDTNKDGKVQYEEFRVFIRHAEAQLLDLFRTIDHDKDGRLDRRELQEAFRLAGIAVPTRKLNDFFNDMDINSDGFISFGEWR